MRGKADIPTDRDCHPFHLREGRETLSVVLQHLAGTFRRQNHGLQIDIGDTMCSHYPETMTRCD